MFAAPAEPPAPTIASQTTESITLNISGPSEGNYDHLIIVFVGGNRNVTVDNATTQKEVSGFQAGKEYIFQLCASYNGHVTCNGASVLGYTGMLNIMNNY